MKLNWIEKMTAVYYWDPAAAPNDQLYYVLPPDDTVYSAFNNLPLRNANLNVKPLYAVSLSNVITCLPIFLRTETGASILTVYNGQLQLLAESSPQAYRGPIVTGYSIIVPKLGEPRGQSFIESKLERPDCIPDLTKRVNLVRNLQLPIEMILSPEIAKVSKIGLPVSDYEVIKNLIEKNKLLTYANVTSIPDSRNSFFLFVDDTGRNHLSIVYYDPVANQIFPPN